MSAAKKHVVAQPFATPHSRFAIGAPVAPADISGDLSFQDWQDKGFIEEVPAEQQEQQQAGDGDGGAHE